MNRNTILHNIINLSISEIVSRLLNFISYIYLARVILAEGFGIISFVVAFSSYFLLIVNFSSDIIASREIARLAHNPPDIGDSQTRQARLTYASRELHEKNARLKSHKIIFVSKILSLRIVLAFVSYMLLVCMVACISQSSEIKVGLLIYGLTFFAQAINLSWYFKGEEKTKAITFAQIFSSLINMLLIITFVKNKVDLTGAIVIFVCVSFINSFLMLIVYLKRERIRLILDAGFMLKNLKESFPVAIAGVMITIYYTLDHVMLGYMTNSTELGYYAAAYKVIIIALMPAGIIYQSFLPQLSNSVNDTDMRKNLMRMYSRWMLLLGVFSSMVIFFFANQIIEIAYGAQFEKSVLLTKILAFNIVLVYLNMTYGNPLITWNKQKLFSYPIIAAAIGNIILNILLIPVYGALGAAIATISSELIVFAGFVPLNNKVIKQLQLVRRD
ncbi:MAG: flippase [Bacteroidetes bacterium]|nr:flippase [Bacteroidota bacterium]